MEEKIANWLENIGVDTEDVSNVSFVEAPVEVKVLEDGDVEQVLSLANISPQVQLLMKSLEAKGPLIVENKMRMIHVSAFIVHEGVNDNGDEFLKEDLQKVVEVGSLFKEGYAGILDYNHDFTPIGYWYDAKYVYDEQAEAYGILAHGAIWAWRYPDQSQQIIEEAQRQGGRPYVSMAVVSKDREVKSDKNNNNRPIQTLRNPIFVGATMLVRTEPGDPSAAAVVDYDPVITTKQQRERMLLVASSENGDDNSLEEFSMDKAELKAALSEVIGDTEGNVIARVAEIVENSVNSLREDKATMDESLATANVRIQELEGTVTELNSSLNEKEVAIEAANSEKVTLAEQMTALEEELIAFRSEAEARELDKLKEVRLAELSEPVRKAIEGKPEDVRNDLITRWAQLDAEAWEARKLELNLAAVETGVNGKPLPGTRNSSGNPSIDSFIKR